MLFQPKKCWRYRELGHHSSDKYCPLTNRRLNVTTTQTVDVTTAQAIEKISNLDLEKA